MHYNISAFFFVLVLIFDKMFCRFFEVYFPAKIFLIFQKSKKVLGDFCLQILISPEKDTKEKSLTSKQQVCIDF